MGHEEHHKSAKAQINVFVVTVSDTRTEENDTSGQLIKERLMSSGNAVAGYKIVPDDPDVLEKLLNELPDSTQAVIINGGTGISKRDNTFDVVQNILDKDLPGFGELFRYLSYLEIGPAAMMSRATAGLMNGLPVFSVPGSTGAVKLAMDKLIIPEIAHFFWEANR